MTRKIGYVTAGFGISCLLACGLVACSGGDVALSVASMSSATSAADAKHMRPTPRYPDGTVRFDRSPGEKGGYWARPSEHSLVQVGAHVKMNGKGLLANIDNASKVAPFKPWALALYKYRQENGLKDDPTRPGRCISPGIPRSLQDPRGFRIIQDRNYNRVYILFGGGNRNWRVIYLDGRSLPNPDDVTPTYVGYSSGHWEGDTLVVKSVGFTDRFWFSNGGLPSTQALKLVERFSRPNYSTLKYQVTIDDPYTYTRPWTSEWTLKWMQGSEIQEHFCEDEPIPSKR